jgi:hypothetical protein
MALDTYNVGDDHYWEQAFTKRYMTSAANWGDVKRCIEVLSQGFTKYAMLHRAEGGFNCLSDTGFESTEPERGRSPSGPIRRKAIRFVPYGFRIDWVSCDHKLMDDVTDDDLIIPPNKVISLRFEGLNCDHWSKATCNELADIIATSLNWSATRRKF